MMRAAVLLTLLTLRAAIAAEVREVIFQGDLAPLNILPTFDKGYLVTYDGRAKVSVYGPKGDLFYHAEAQVPQARFVNVLNAAVDADGTMVTAVEYQRGRTGGGFSLFDRTGAHLRFVDTGGYLPTQVCFSPDHSIWTLGWRGLDSPRPGEDYTILRRYSAEGRLLGGSLPRSMFVADPDPVGPMVGGWQLRIANGRVGALLYGSSVLKQGIESRRMAQWIELDLTGTVLGRWDLPGTNHVGAYTSGGEVYLQSAVGSFVLDRASGSWRPVAGMPRGRLLGADGEDLIFKLTGNTIERISVSQ